MENASKALIMAAGVLIALMIIGALLLMFNSLSNYQGSDTQTTREAQIVAFNQQYITYNRENVRGSDLYSLLNKVIDYNRRKSTEGTGKDEGQYIAYEPMTIKFEIDRSKLNVDGTNRLFIENTYTVSSNSNKFEKKVKENLEYIKSETGLTDKELQDLCIAMNKIFIKPYGDEEQKKRQKIQAIQTYNGITSAELPIDTDENIKNSFETISKKDKNVYAYYEYIQFKRARFDCVNIEYNDKTGRVIKMEFKFNGKFN